MAHQPGPKELQLKELKAARLARKSNPFEARGARARPGRIARQGGADQGKNA